jgi:NADH dehydrogenase
VNSSNSEKLVTVIGGSGFIGRHVVKALAKRGYRVRVACRRPDLAGHVVPAGSVGQVVPVQANVRYPVSVNAACDGAYAIINLPSVLSNSGQQTFDAINGFGSGVAAKAARQAGAQVFIQMSSIGADAESASAYTRSKAEGEKLVKAAFPNAVILRPSIVFGPEDNFFNRFAGMARISPALPLIGGATKFQPVFVSDVAEAIATLVDRGEASGKTYELGGPDVASFEQLMRFTLATTFRKRILLPLPWPVAKLMGAVMGLLPGAPLTMDQVESLKTDNVVSEAASSQGRDLRGLGISPRSYETVVPTYLYRFRKEGQFTTAP